MYVWVWKIQTQLEPLCESETALPDWNVTPPIIFWFVCDTWKGQNEEFLAQFCYKAAKVLLRHFNLLFLG